MSLGNIVFGFYRHYKGGLYLVLGVGRLSEDREQQMVIYFSLKKRQAWLRPLKMFNEVLDINNTKVPRFKKIIGV